MPLRTVLVHGGIDKQLPVRIALASGLARAHDAKLMLVSPLDGYSAALLYAEYAPAAAIEQHVAAEWRQAKEIGVQAADHAAHAGVRLEWRGVEGRPQDVLAAAGAAADVIVLSQDEADSASSLVATVTLTAGRPVLCVPYSGAFTTWGRRILVAWNGSRESARAMHDVLPFLHDAERVILFTAEGASGSCTSARDAAACLAAHGVAVERQHATIDGHDAGGAILKAASQSGADMIVMGAYGHRRLREWAFGGTTRTILRSMMVPTLLSH